MRARIYDRQRNPADTAQFMLPVSFTDAYKNWRNRARKFSLESIVSGAIEVLCEPSSDPVAELGKAPWLTLLMVKWACRDRHSGRAHMPAISRAQLNDLRQRLWDFPERLDTGSAGTMPPELFMRQLVRPQLGFQRCFRRGLRSRKGRPRSAPRKNTVAQACAVGTGGLRQMVTSAPHFGQTQVCGVMLTGRPHTCVCPRRGGSCSPPRSGYYARSAAIGSSCAAWRAG